MTSIQSEDKRKGGGGELWEAQQHTKNRIQPPNRRCKAEKPPILRQFEADVFSAFDF